MRCSAVPLVETSNRERLCLGLSCLKTFINAIKYETKWVSTRECGNCGADRASGLTGFILPKSPKCPVCDSEDVRIDEDKNEQECISCGFAWEPYDRIFVCDHCKQRSLARHNAA